jgi:transposase
LAAKNPPDRSAESLAQWLQEHPGVEFISRDRGKGFIEGATNGAPDAIQVADRFHLPQNLVDALMRMYVECPSTHGWRAALVDQIAGCHN